MLFHRRKVTIEIDQYTLRVEQAVPKSPEDFPSNSAVSDVAPSPSPPDRRPAAEDASRTLLLPLED